MSFECCPKCKGKNGLAPEGYIMKDKVAIECECHVAWRKEQQAKKLYKHYGFDMRNYDYNPRTYVGTKSIENKDRMLNYITQFKDNPAVRKLLVYMYGGNGCQKSTLASYVGKQLICSGFSVRYILMDKLVTLLQNASFKSEAQEQLDKLNSSDLLIIDESFDKSKMKLYSSGYQISFIDNFIRERIQLDNKGIVFISNVKPADIEKQGFSPSIQDFIVRETMLNNTLLTFEDNYIECANIEFDSSRGLF